MGHEISREAVTCIEHSEFDSHAFGFPWYRVYRLDQSLLPTAVSALRVLPGPLFIDAKTESDDDKHASLLMKLGFRKVCTQFRLTHSSFDCSPHAATGVGTARGLLLPESDVWKHARNFRYDRFSLDPLLPAGGRHQLYFNWITNSLRSERKVIAHVGGDFCSFAEAPDGLVIDLVSVLRPRLGIGAKLVAAVTNYARSRGFSKVTVTTECENTPAWRLYLKCGFQVSAFVSVFHFACNNGQAMLQESLCTPEHS